MNMITCECVTKVQSESCYQNVKVSVLIWSTFNSPEEKVHEHNMQIK